VVLVISVCVACDAHGARVSSVSAIESEKAFQRLGDQIEAIGRSHPEFAQEMGVSDLQECMANFRQRGPRGSVPKAYVDALDASVSALSRIAAGDTVGGAEQVAFIRADLAAKCSSRNGPTTAARVIAKLKVQAWSLSGDVRVGGYLVRCCPILLSGDEYTIAFARATDPKRATSEDIPPGLYRFWLERPSGKQIVEQPVTIQSANGKRVDVDLIIQ